MFSLLPKVPDEFTVFRVPRSVSYKCSGVVKKVVGHWMVCKFLDSAKLPEDFPENSLCHETINRVQS